MIQTIKSGQTELIKKIKQRSKENFDLALARVAPIIKDIKTLGDKALFQYIEKYDCFKATKNN